MKRNTTVLTTLLPMFCALSCAPQQPVRGSAGPSGPSEPDREPDAAVAGIAEPAVVFRDMNMLTQGTPLAFAGSVAFFAGPTPDSTMMLFSLSLTNDVLLFQRTAAMFQAGYRVEASIRSGSWSRELNSDQVVRVPSLVEARRSDETVIFQQAILVPPGEATIAVMIRDAHRDRAARDQRTIQVPDFGKVSLSSLSPVYEARGRKDRSARLDLVPNPRAVATVGGDTLGFYVEVTGASSPTLTVRAVDEFNTEVWRTEPALSGDSALRHAFVQLQPGSPGMGRLRFEAIAGNDTVRTPVLVGYVDRLAAAKFAGVLELLRYFRAAGRVGSIQAAPDSSKTGLWNQFVKDSDSNPATPANEALVEYFARVRTANRDFTEGGLAGWLTDRGEVLLRLGEPDEVFDMGGGMQMRVESCMMNCPSVGWRYRSRSLVVVFSYDSGRRRYRIDPSSRRELERVLGRGGSGG